VFERDRFRAAPFAAGGRQELPFFGFARDGGRFGVGRSDPEHFGRCRRFLFAGARDVFRSDHNAQRVTGVAVDDFAFRFARAADVRAFRAGFAALLPPVGVRDRRGARPGAFGRGQGLPGDRKAERERSDHIRGCDPGDRRGRFGFGFAGAGEVFREHLHAQRVAGVGGRGEVGRERRGAGGLRGFRSARVAAQPFVFEGDRFGARPFAAGGGQELPFFGFARDGRRLGVHGRVAARDVRFFGGRR